MRTIKSALILLAFCALACAVLAQTQTSLNNGPWKLASQADVTETGEQISAPSYATDKWYPATVPGTVLTTLVNNKVYPEPLYGENDRPDRIPESLCRTSYWYRTTFTVPSSYAGRRIWLNFDGINYSAEVWLNGKHLGMIKGAFSRGIFDISSVAKPGAVATLAVRVSPQPNPGNPNEHTVAHGTGKNGGITAIDGATFLCTIGWDWIPGIRDRDTGIWQKVFLSATGPVLVQEPLVTSDLALPGLDTADLKIQATLKNVTDKSQNGLLQGTFGDISFQHAVEVEAHSTKVVTLDPATAPQLKLKHPKLWWPNGYGPQNLYPVHLAFEIDGAVSDERNLSIGIRKITYTVSGTEDLTLSVNGVPVVCKGGDWGMDEAMKRIPRERLEAQIRMHQLANYTMIRNWVGQSTSEDFYDLCDKYGLMLWDEFFQPNPGDGPNPTDLDTYLANCREKIVRFRNHPSIAVWCGRNEGNPPPDINKGLQKLMSELEPTRHYQPSSKDGHGVKSGGPYRWRTPQEYYNVDAAFKTEIGSMSIPTLEAVQAMMPQKDWESINDDWAEHDFAKGAQSGDVYPGELCRRYGKVLNLADFVRKAQLANYEAFRAMYEGRFAKLFQPTAGVLTWMSNPAQPSFVWQLYSWDLEPNSSLFGTRKACEPVHIMLNELIGHVEVINNKRTPISGATASVVVYNQDGTVAYQHEQKVEALASAATDLGAVEPPTTLSKLYFVSLRLHDAAGQLLSGNFYWRGAPDQEGNLQDLESLPVVKLETTVKRHDADGKCRLDVTIRNPSSKIALMAHLQLRRHNSGERVLPVYYSQNYLSLTPQESETVTIEAANTDLHGDKPLVVLDGWNVDVASTSSGNCDVALNQNAQVSSWPVTGIPIKWFNGPLGQIKIKCWGTAVKDFVADVGYDLGSKGGAKEVVDTSTAPLAPPELYKTARVGECTYKLPMKPALKGYRVRLYFAETEFEAPGKRVFNVDINDQPVLVNFDIYAAAGGLNKAVVKEVAGILPDNEGNICIHFRPGLTAKAKNDEPRINGIEVLPVE